MKNSNEEIKMKCKKKSVFDVNGGDYTWECEEEAIEGSDYCILHTEYPEYGTTEYYAIHKLKEDKFRDKLRNKDFNFISAVYNSIEFIKDMEISHMDFMNAELGDIHFENMDVVGNILKNIDATINFEGAKIRTVQFINVKCDFLNFNKVKANEISFHDVEVGTYANFGKITLSGNISGFNNMKLGGDITFTNSKILCDNLDIDFTKIKGNMYLKDTQFKRPTIQEKMFRLARNIWESKGDRVEADNCFYKEMEAKRKQKKWYFRYPEIVIQYCFGYGVYPARFMVTWISVILVFTVIYSTQTGLNANLGFLSYLYSSVVTAITPGFGTYRPEGNYQLVASVEAILGTFMWAALIATFTRKYMR